MARELPRTLRSLSADYQTGLGEVDYEILVVDNGSPVPVDAARLKQIDRRIRVHRVENAAPSPAAAANLGIDMTAGRAICLLLDGARLVTPGVLGLGLKALRANPRAIATPMAWHLGPAHQSISIRDGYDANAEDTLLAGIGWPLDPAPEVSQERRGGTPHTDTGYRLFEIAALAGANREGFFGGLNESCALMLRRELWTEVGGLDERFAEPGGGYVSLDLFERLVALPDTELVVLLGEGSFHQVHGGASTNPEVQLAGWAANYAELRGRKYRRPVVHPTYLGTMPEPARRWILPRG